MNVIYIYIYVRKAVNRRFLTRWREGRKRQQHWRRHYWEVSLGLREFGGFAGIWGAVGFGGFRGCGLPEGGFGHTVGTTLSCWFFRCGLQLMSCLSPPCQESYSGVSVSLGGGLGFWVWGLGFRV